MAFLAAIATTAAAAASATASAAGTALVGTAAIGTPGTLGFVASTPGLIGAGGSLTAGGLATTAAVTGSVLTGVSASRQNEFQADVADANAKSAKMQASAEADRLRRAHRRASGATRAAIGAAGIQMEGTPLELLADQASEQRLNESIVQFGGRVGAQQQRLSATAFRQRATGSLIGSGLQAGAYGAQGIVRFA